MLHVYLKAKPICKELPMKIQVGVVGWKILSWSNIYQVRNCSFKGDNSNLVILRGIVGSVEGIGGFCV